jgi:DNA-binding MarR family transcriptional regulator
VRNVSGPAAPVNDPGDPSPAAAQSLGREALEIGKLLGEVIDVGHGGRRGGRAPAGSATPAEGAFTALRGASGRGTGSNPLASHVIRAAIFVYTHGPQTIGQLASGLGISQGWASRVVDEMERAGYLERRRDPDDRRVVRVSLVPAAVERVERAYRWRGDAVESALEGMSPEERGAVRTFLGRFVEASRDPG